jgi:hypothetical protein
MGLETTTPFEESHRQELNSYSRKLQLSQQLVDVLQGGYEYEETIERVQDVLDFHKKCIEDTQ